MDRPLKGMMRTIAHPGAPQTPRTQIVDVDISMPERLIVEAGCDLFETIHAALDARNAAGGSFTLAGGVIERLSLMTGGPGEGDLPMGFHGPFVLAAPLAVVAGAAGTGIAENGVRFTHCHASFRDRDDRLVGGHLIQGETIAGAGGILVDLVALSGGRFARRFDPETRFTIFHPEQL